jgi:hypothetical protein
MVNYVEAYLSARARTFIAEETANSIASVKVCGAKPK